MSFEQLEIQISDNASQAADGLEALRATLEKLKGATNNSAGLNKIAKSLEKINTAVFGLNFGPLANQTQQLVKALEPLQNLGKTNLNSFINSLKQIPDVTKSLDPAQMDRFGTAVRRVADAVKPLATEMEKIAMGFSAMPKRIQSFITQMERSGRGATTAAKGYKAAANGLAALNQKFNIGVLYAGMRRLANVLGNFVESSNQYVEDINLFTVSMGEFADAAYDYAMSAQELMGIDAGQFMRNQGIFQSIASGFGVASDQASVLSQNLSQLGFDKKLSLRGVICVEKRGEPAHAGCEQLSVAC